MKISNSRWQNELNHLQSNGFLSGSSAVFSLAHIWASRLLITRGLQPHILDCAIRFDALLLAEDALRQNIDPDFVLEQVLVQRLFNPYHILETVRTLKTDENKVYIVLAPLKQFFDGDVAFDESIFLIDKLMIFLKQICQSGVKLLIVERDHYRHSVFNTSYKKLKQQSAVNWYLQQTTNEHYTLKTSLSGGIYGPHNSTLLNSN